MSQHQALVHVLQNFPYEALDFRIALCKTELSYYGKNIVELA